MFCVALFLHCSLFVLFKSAIASLPASHRASWVSLYISTGSPSPEGTRDFASIRFLCLVTSVFNGSTLSRLDQWCERRKRSVSRWTPPSHWTPLVQRCTCDLELLHLYILYHPRIVCCVSVCVCQVLDTELCSFKWINGWRDRCTVVSLMYLWCKLWGDKGMQARTQNSKPSTSARPVLGATIFTVFDSFQSLSIVYFQVRMSCWPKKNKKQNFNMQLSTAFILHFFSKLLFIRSRSQSCNIIGPHIPPLLLSQPFLLRFHKHSPYASTP